MTRRGWAEPFLFSCAVVAWMLSVFIGCPPCAAAELAKIDFALRKLVGATEYDDERLLARPPEQEGSTRVCVFVEAAESDAELPGEDVKVLARAGSLLVVSVPLDRILDLARLPQVVRMEGPAPVSPALNVSVPEIGADRVWSDPRLGLDEGEGVVLGMVDTGINLLHEAFLDDGGRSRVRYVWDMSDGGGPPPAEDVCGHWDVGGRWVPGPCGGSECTREQIVSGACRQKDLETGRWAGHGTAVMGTQAGGWRASCDATQGGACRGVAPLAEIVTVKLDDFTSQEIVQGTAYIFRKADELGLPAVVNLSLSGYSGPRDGSSLFERFLSAQSGPGRVVVAAAGNEGLKEEHAETALRQGGALRKVYAQMSGGSQWRIGRLEGWYSVDGSPDIRVRVLRSGFPSSQVVIDWLRFGDAESVEFPREDPLYKARLFHTEWTDKAQGFVLEIETREQPVREWQVELQSAGAGGTETVVDLWIHPLVGADPQTGSVPFRFSPGVPGNVSRAKTLTVPCTADEVICVSSYNTRCPSGFCGQPLGGALGNDDVGTYSAFSSRGPRRDGAPKPELGAPGQAIIMPYVPGAASAAVAAGTSFSAPHVSGTLALLLRNDERLTPEDIVLSFGAGTLQPWRIDETVWERETEGYRGLGRLDAASLVAALYDLPAPPAGLTARVVGESQVRLQWEASPSPGVGAYRIYSDRGTGIVDYRNPVGTVPGSEAAWVTPQPVPAGLYSFGVRAVGADGREDRNRAIATLLVMPRLFGGAGDSDFCFIATAAFESAESPRVDRLRAIRDRYLLPRGGGRVLVDGYYRIGPELAGLLEGSPLALAGVRAALMPAVGFSELMVYRGSFERLAVASGCLVCMLVVVSAVLCVRVRRGRRLSAGG